MSNHRSLILFIWYMLSICLVTVGAQNCYGTENFTTDGAYAKNREILLSSLSSNVVRSDGFFYPTETGEDPDKVYGYALCRGYASAEECSSCVNTTSEKIMVECPYQKEAYRWDGIPTCLVRYSDQPILGQAKAGISNDVYNTGSISSNWTDFDERWANFVNSTIKEASAGSSTLKFARNEEELPWDFAKMYALMQCTPDLSQRTCSDCLRERANKYRTIAPGKQGGIFNSPSCIFRWELYSFLTPPPESTNDTSVATSPPAPGSNKPITLRTIVIIIVSIIIFMILVVFFLCFLLKRNQKQTKNDPQEKYYEIEAGQSLKFDFSTIMVATNNFSADQKLGEGGFGAVYKGMLPNGQLIAVKRLSNNSEQGEIEFKNEVVVVAKLQHRNLARLFGFCFEGSERLLIYEYVPNSSLEKFIFDPVQHLLEWETRYKIINGIARGILYLHEDSRLRVIHRDLKASNVLLDEHMNPKISDFGMAKLFAVDQIQGDTRRIVGTFGYMPPEYVRFGHFSIKLDVFSFGVLLLEIISGQKNGSFHMGGEAQNFLAYAWDNWRGGNCWNFIDPKMKVASVSDIMRCIHIGLLCVQENAESRPTMGSVVLMLTSSSLTLALPSKPAFYSHTGGFESTSQSTTSERSRSGPVPLSNNEVTISELDPR